MKWRLIIMIILVTLSGSFLINACRKGQEDVPGKTGLTFTVPAGFPAPLYDFSKNPLTEEGFQLAKCYFMMAVFLKMEIIHVLPVIIKLPFLALMIMI